MRPGFIELDSSRFYREVWCVIEKDVDDIDSNLAFIRKNALSWAPRPALIVHWGYKDKISGEQVVLAVSWSHSSGPDRHWVSPTLLDS